MTQEEIRNNFSKNIIELRKSMNLTQLAMAQKLNYSDKAVSKWEVGTVLPDIETMVSIADFFGVTVNDLIYDKKCKVKQKAVLSKISLVSAGVFAVFFLSSIVFFILNYGLNIDRSWLAFIVAIPISAIVLIWASVKWFNRVCLYIGVTLCFWGVLLNIYLFTLNFNLWFIFIVGVIGQVLISSIFMVKTFGRNNRKSRK